MKALAKTSGIDEAAFLDLRESAKAFDYSERDAILYALSAGMGRDPLYQNELKFVYEGQGFVAMPTLAAVVARSMLPRTLPINVGLTLHGEQRLRVHRPIPTAAQLSADTRITKIVDKGPGKGALIYSETEARIANEQAPLFTTGMTLFARGDGGFGGSAGPVEPVHPIPSKPADFVHRSETRHDQALLYRLTGDRNPLHADPEVARSAGFERPILHGLCTYAVACRALLAAVCSYNPAMIKSFDVRFTSPVFPGDSIETDIWIDGAIASFRCRVPERDVVVLNNGRAELDLERHLITAF